MKAHYYYILITLSLGLIACRQGEVSHIMVEFIPISLTGRALTTNSISMLTALLMMSMTNHIIMSLRLLPMAGTKGSMVAMLHPNQSMKFFQRTDRGVSSTPSLFLP